MVGHRPSLIATGNMFDSENEYFEISWKIGSDIKIDSL
jgi:hypothetical protein